MHHITEVNYAGFVRPKL